MRYSQLGRRAAPPTIARLMTVALENPELLSLAAGFTDNRTLPAAQVAASVQSLTAEGAPREVLQYGSNVGRSDLRRSLAERLARQESGLEAEELWLSSFITNGSQQALYLAMQVLCDPGDIVLVDRPSYFVYLEMLKGLGVVARSLPVDATGRLDPAALQTLLAELLAAGQRERIKAVYLVSYLSNPSGRSLEEAEKNRLAEVLATHELFVPVIEDAAYRELGFLEPERVPSVLSLPAWRDFPRLYLSTLTKPFASGLKVGYGFCTEADWRDRLLHVKGHHDFGTAHFNQALLASVLADGGFDRQLARIRPAYQKKMLALHQTLLDEGLASLGWRWSPPAGGLYLWLEAPPTLATGLDSAFCRVCLEEGVLYVPGALCFGDDPPDHFVRLSFGVLPEEDLRAAGRRFVRAARALA